MIAQKIKPTIEHLDFTPTCNGKKGECHNRADYVVAHHCPHCKWSSPRPPAFACADCWSHRHRDLVRCAKCGITLPHGDTWQIIEVLT